MIIVRIKGGIGNQLFQYAAGYALSKRLNQALYFDTSFFDDKTTCSCRLPLLKPETYNCINEKELSAGVLLLKNKYLNKFFRKTGTEDLRAGRYQYILEKDHADLTDAVLKTDKSNIYLDGYFQSPVYFQQYEKEIRAQFTPGYELPQQVSETEEQMKNCESVAVHVRRGDFIGEISRGSIYHYMLDESYYLKAMELIREKTENPVFFWFSNDIDWVKKCFGEHENFRFVSSASETGDVDEMFLMSKCRHIISANSTFSWWGAYLNQNNNAFRIVPEKQYGSRHMIPDDWIRL